MTCARCGHEYADDELARQTHYRNCPGESPKLRQAETALAQATVFTEFRAKAERRLDALERAQAEDRRVLARTILDSLKLGSYLKDLKWARAVLARKEEGDGRDGGAIPGGRGRRDGADDTGDDRVPAPGAVARLLATTDAVGQAWEDGGLNPTDTGNERLGDLLDAAAAVRAEQARGGISVTWPGGGQACKTWDEVLDLALNETEKEPGYKMTGEEKATILKHLQAAQAEQAQAGADTARLDWLEAQTQGWCPYWRVDRDEDGEVHVTRTTSRKDGMPLRAALDAARGAVPSGEPVEPGAGANAAGVKVRKASVDEWPVCNCRDLEQAQADLEALRGKVRAYREEWNQGDCTGNARKALFAAVEDK